MNTPQFIRHEVRNRVRNWSGADVARRHEVRGAASAPATASGCQGLSSLRFSTPGECGSRGRSSLRSFLRPMVGRSTATMQSHSPGLRPGTPAGTPFGGPHSAEAE